MVAPTFVNVYAEHTLNTTAHFFKNNEEGKLV